MKIVLLNSEMNLNEYLKLITQLKPTNLSINELKNIINNLPNNHFIYVIEENNKILGSITFILEQKIIHNGKKVLHIEDVVVDKNNRGLGLASKLLDFSKEFALENNCYKIILDCQDNLIKFYQKNKFKKTSNQMSIYF